MPFATDIGLLVYSAISGWELFDSSMDKTESGWDVLNATFVYDYGALTGIDAEVAASSWHIGDAVTGFSNFWVVGVKAKCLGGGIWAVDITGWGMAEERPMKVSIHGAVDHQSKDNVAAPGYGSPVNVAVLEANPVVECEYLQIGGTVPTNLVGTAGTPPVSVSHRDSVWTSLSDPTVHIPHGWVLLDLPVEKIPGQNVYLIKEVWQWIFEFSP